MSEPEPVIESTAIELHEPQGLAVIPTVKAVELVERLSVIREAMQTAMQPDIDYGHIPGTDKPALFKPGAEKLSVLFQLDVQLVNEKVWGPGDHLTVMSRATVFHAPSGQRLGYGEGLCTTKEKKYGKRKQERVCPSCGSPAVIKGKAEYGGGWLCWAKRGGCGAKFSDGDPAIEGQPVGEVENAELPDLWNTVVKMAEKRARVDAVLAVTGASALFTQDIADEPQDASAGFTESPGGHSTARVEDSPYVGDDDHAPEYIDRGGRDTRTEAEKAQRPELKSAAAGLKWVAIKDCYTVAGLAPPAKAAQAFTGLDDVEAAALEAALRNRRFHDLEPTDAPYGLEEIRKAHGDTTDVDDLPWPRRDAVVDTAESVQADQELLPLPTGSAPIDAEISAEDLADARKRLAEEDAKGA